MTTVATLFLFFVYFFDWIIYGRSQFTLVGAENKTECKSRPLPIDEATRCGAQDLNSRVKLKFDYSYFVVETTDNARCRSLCLEPHNLVAEISQTLNIVEPTGLQHISIQPQFDGIHDKIRWQINNSHYCSHFTGFCQHLSFGTSWHSSRALARNFLIGVKNDTYAILLYVQEVLTHLI